MDKIFNRPVLSLGILFILCLYLFFFQLGALALTDPDETFYAQTAKEMLQRNEWSTPYLYDKPQFEKPIFFYWLVQASFRMFGINEFAARLPSAVFALAGVIALYFLGALLFNRRAGFLSAVILASNIEYIVLARGCLTDMTLFSLMLLGVTAFFYGYVRKRAWCYLLSAAFFGLAVLTKGPIAIILPVMALGLYVVWSRDRGLLKKIPWIGCIAVFILVSGPWYVITYLFHRKEFIDMFFGFQNITRFLESEHKMGSQVYYNIPVLFAGFSPWSVFLPFGLWRAFRQTNYQLPITDYQRRYMTFLLSWFAVIFVFFTVSSTKLPTYIFPCWISMALVTGGLWDEFLTRSASRGTDRAMAISYYLLFGAILAAACGALIFIKIDYPDMAAIAIAPAVALVLGFTAATALFFRKMFTGAFFAIVIALTLFLYPVAKFVFPQIGLYESSKEAAVRLLSYMKPGEMLGSESHYRAGLAFYTGRMPLNMDPHEEMLRLLDSDERTWFVLKEKNHIQIYMLDTKPFCKKPSYAVYKMGKKVIATNRLPEDGRYLIKRERT